MNDDQIIALLGIPVGFLLVWSFLIKKEKSALYRATVSFNKNLAFGFGINEKIVAFIYSGMGIVSLVWSFVTLFTGVNYLGA